MVNNMAINERIKKADKKLKKVEDTLEELNNQSVAMQVLQFSKEQNKISNDNLMATNKRLFILLVLSLVVNVAIGSGFFYYVTHYTNETTIEDANANDGGNACVGDNCYNGDVDYGKSKTSY